MLHSSFPVSSVLRPSLLKLSLFLFFIQVVGRCITDGVTLTMRLLLSPGMFLNIF